MKNSHINDGWLDTLTTDQREIIDFRGEGCEPLLSMGRFQYDSATEPLPEQQHNDWLVLVFPLEGAQHYWVNGKETLLRAGQILRIAPGTRYGTGVWPEQRGSLAWLILSTKPQGESGLGVDSAVFQRLAEPTAPLVCEKPPMTRALIKAIFNTWEQRENPLHRELIRHQLATLLLMAATGFEDAGAGHASSHSGARILSVVKWIGENLRDDIMIDELVNRSGLSRSRFLAEFKEQTGMTPKDFILRSKVHEAARLLRAKPSPAVTAVAHEMGFSSSQYFATVFRRYLGISPGEYRG